jgi:predicted phosphodiesterase
MGFLVYFRNGQTLANFTSRMNRRIIAIGDIHGCYQEFADLLGLLQLTQEDQLVLLGDLVNRGPDSGKVIDLAREHNALALLGNHEARLLAFRRTANPEPLKDDDEKTCAALQPHHWTYLEKMPLTHEVPALNTVFVHGGFLPGEPWQKQPAQIVTRIQVIDSNGKPRKRSDAPEAMPWADQWNGPPFVVYGHTPRSEIYKLKWSVGIDTACVMGGFLTAFILPERRCLQIKARRRYFP